MTILAPWGISYMGKTDDIFILNQSQDGTWMVKDVISLQGQLTDQWLMCQLGNFFTNMV